MAIDLKKIQGVDRIVAVTGVLAFISMFLPWYGASAGPFSTSVSGIGSGWGWLGALAIIAAGVYVIMTSSGQSIKVGNLGPAATVAGLSVLGTVIVVLRWLTMPSGGVGGFSYGPRIGIYVALVVGIVQSIVSVKFFRRSGESTPWGHSS